MPPTIIVKSNKGLDTELIRKEVFRTPLLAYKLLIDKYPKNFANGRIIDLSAGDGRMVDYIIKQGNKNKHCLVDIRKDELKIWQNNKRLAKCKHIIKDFQKLKIKSNKYSCCITNPPFSLAEKMVDFILPKLPNNGIVWILQRTDWLGGLKRSHWHVQHKTLCKVEIITRRPKWEVDDRILKNLGMMNYAWFCYAKNNKEKPTIDWLLET